MREVAWLYLLRFSIARKAGSHLLFVGHRANREGQREGAGEREGEKKKKLVQGKHTHTHTHTEREREREKRGKR